MTNRFDLTEDDFKSTEFIVQDNKPEHYDIQPRNLYLHDGEFVYGGSPVSRVYGVTSLTGQPSESDPIQIQVYWQSQGQKEGTFQDLFRWDNPQAYDVYVTPDITLTTADGANKGDLNESDELKQTILEHLDSRTNWQGHALLSLPIPPATVQIGSVDLDRDLVELSNDIGCNALFHGREIHRASELEYKRPTDHKFAEMNLYQTEEGHFVCQRVEHSRNPEVSTRHAVFEASTIDKLAEQIGEDTLGRHLINTLEAQQETQQDAETEDGLSSDME